MLTECSIRIREDNALIRKILLHAVVDYLGFILCRYTGEELLLCLRNTELVEGFLDLGRNLFPCFSLLLGRSYIILNIFEIQIIQIAAPFRHRHFAELLQGFQAEVKHPLRLVFDCGDFADDFFRESFTRLKYRLVLITESVLVFLHIRRFLSHGISLLISNGVGVLLPLRCLCEARSMPG
ncbi:hypothetical protein D3C75_935950 [compost metagenome]